MIYYLKGKVEIKEEKFAVIEVAGIGYKVFCSPNTLKKFDENKEFRVLCFLVFKEGLVELYGFLKDEELKLFEILNEISGIGPKTAMLLASLGPLEKLKEIIEKGELPQEIKGIGGKKAQKILLELTGKVKEIKKPQKIIKSNEVLDALISLGFSKKVVEEALSMISEEITESEKIKQALKILGRTKP